MKNRTENTIKKILEISKKIDKKKVLNIMEVCGTHTMTIARYGIQQLMPPIVNLISGPGCPVCVTPISDIDWILDIIKRENFKTFTFGDLIKVPGTYSSLNVERSKGANINICYSPTTALEYAENNRKEKVLFLAIGFETTAPLTAVLLKRAYDKKINNFFIFSTHKIIPPALLALLRDDDVEIDGLLLPGHVTAITGTKPFEFIPDKYNIPCVVTGFEAQDILLAVRTILTQIHTKFSTVEIEYRRVVKAEGNQNAVKQLHDTFDVEDSIWRGIGEIPKSGLRLKEKFAGFDAKRLFPAPGHITKEPQGCLCGDILRGIKKPTDCKLFLKTCSPDNPVGPCMVSSEGACAAYFRYRRSDS